MNKINVKKLLHSKWTATTPVQKEKHFIVTTVEYQESGAVEYLVMEAVMSRRTLQLDWQELKNSSGWQQGWK